MIRKSLLLLLLCAPVGAETVTVAVASNFSGTARDIAKAFEADTKHNVRLSTGSSGKLYAQIINGAPFDVFLSADQNRPLRLEEEGFASHGDTRPYAIGRLVIWSSEPGLDIDDCKALLASPGKARIAIANPLFAPYGIAARQYLQHEGWWEVLEPNLVIGENISQTLQFATSGGARVGLVANSQVRGRDGSCRELVPDDLHAPIEQHVVLLKRAEANAAGRAFMSFLGSESARAIIKAAGYRLPQEPQ